MASYPGVFTPSDAFRAIRAGATGLKFFPAEVLGTKGIKAMKAVLPPALPLYAVGGANPDNFREYFEAGCAGFGLGSYIYKPGMSLAEIGERARAAVRAYDEGQRQMNDTAELFIDSRCELGRGRHLAPASGAAVLVRHPQQDALLGDRRRHHGRPLHL